MPVGEQRGEEVAHLCSRAWCQQLGLPPLGLHGRAQPFLHFNRSDISESIAAPSRSNPILQNEPINVAGGRCLVGAILSQLLQLVVFNQLGHSLGLGDRLKGLVIDIEMKHFHRSAGSRFRAVLGHGPDDLFTFAAISGWQSVAPTVNPNIAAFSCFFAQASLLVSCPSEHGFLSLSADGLAALTITANGLAQMSGNTKTDQFGSPESAPRVPVS